MRNNNSNSILPCQKCKISFDLETRLPKILPCCKETICRKCLERIPFNPTRKCPYCDEKHQSSTIFQTNQKIAGKIDNSQWEICLQHKKANRFYCEDEGRKLCSDCPSDANCINHEPFPLEMLKPDAEKGRKAYEKALDSLEKHYFGVKDQFDAQRQSMEKMICDFYEEQKSKLERNKVRALFSFNTSYNHEKAEFESHFGKESGLGNELKAIISDHINFYKIPNPIEFLGNKHSDLHAKINDIHNLEKRLLDMSKNLKNKLREQSEENEKSGTDFLVHITEKMKTKNLPKFKGTKHHQSVKKEGFRIMSKLQFTINKRVLIIKESESKTQTTWNFSQDTFQHFSHIDFYFNGFSNIENEDWESLSKLMYKFYENQDNLKIQLRARRNKGSTNQISRLFSIVFQNLTKISSLKISFPFSKDSMFLLTTILPHLSNLQSLLIRFKRKVFPMEHFENFILALKTLAPKLEFLSLNFSQNEIQVSKLQEIFIEMPLLKTFNLNVREMSKLDQKPLEILARKVDKLMPKLQKLTLDITKTAIQDSFVDILEFNCDAIPKVKIINEKPEVPGGPGGPGEPRVPRVPRGPVRLEEN